jgi:GntR family transcriptional regulator
MALNRYSSVPLYRQIKDKIVSDIEDGVWKPGDLVPSGPELSKRYDVSVGTVRRAMEELMNEGVLVAVQGKGTFVARPKVSIKLPYFRGFTKDMILRGHIPETKLVGEGIVSAGSMVAKALRVEAGYQVSYCERLRLADGEPILFEISYLDPRRFPGLNFPKRGHQSLYAVLEQEYGVEVVRAEQTLYAVATTPKQAEMLGVSPGSPAFRLVSVEYDFANKPVQATVGTYRGDRYTLEFERIRRA